MRIMMCIDYGGGGGELDDGGDCDGGCGVYLLVKPTFLSPGEGRGRGKRRSTQCEVVTEGGVVRKDLPASAGKFWLEAALHLRAQSCTIVPLSVTGFARATSLPNFV
jgi:hypothetical protein